MRALKSLFLGVLLLAVASANAFALVNAALVADDKVGYETTFDVKLIVTGSDKVGAMTLKVAFDPVLAEVTAITAGAMGPVVPGSMTTVNTNKNFTIAYANVAGFTPDAAGSVVATITCKAGKTPGGNAAFTFDATSNIKGATGFPPPTLTGTLTPKTVAIVDPATLNTCPTAKGATLEVDEDSKGVEGVLVGEDADGNALKYSIVEQSAKGTATITDETSGKYTFVPKANENGNTSFTFKVNDGKCDSAAVGTVVVNIKAVDDFPVAEDGELIFDEGKTGSGKLLATDADTTTFKFSIATQGKLGAASVLNAETGEYQYVPTNPDVNGTDEFTFKVESGTPALSDTGTIKVTINKVNDAPVAKLEDQKLLAAVLSIPASMTGTLIYNDADGDTLTVTVTQPTTGKIEITDPKTGAYKYTPTSPFPVALPAKDSFKFKVKDAALESAEVTVNMTIESGAHKLTVKKVLPDGGTVKPNGEVVVEDGKDQEFVVTVNEGYYVASARVVWADTTKKTFAVKDGKFTVPAVKQDGVLTVTFKAQYTISVSALPSRAGRFCLDPNPHPLGYCYGGYSAFRVNGGADQKFTFEAYKAWMIDEVKIDGVVATITDAMSKTFTHTFVKVDANHTVDVVFERTGEIHSGDTDASNDISLAELQRVISLYNRNDGKYICNPYSEDGYDSGDDATKRTCLPHDADFEDIDRNPVHDWKIGLSELLRVIQFWSLNGYHRATLADEGFPTKDGFAPGK